MPDPKFLKPWHGIPREAIEWNPTVDIDACIGCGTCVTGCNRLVYRYDYDARKPIVFDPLNCMVGCTTCANTCPTHALHFPSISTVFALEAKAAVRHAIEDDLILRKTQLAFAYTIPHPDKVLSMQVTELKQINDKTLMFTLSPVSKGDCFCQFIPGQYVEIIPPTGQWLPRAYSIGNAPRDGGCIELQIRHVEEGRFSNWLFNELKKGDVLKVRGPRGNFTMKSVPDKALVFVAGGTGFAPVKALIEQQLKLNRNRKMQLFWGIGSADDMYDAETLVQWTTIAPNLKCTVAIDQGELPESLKGITVHNGRLADIIKEFLTVVEQADVYVAGPPAMMPGVVQTLIHKNISPESIHIDSFGL